MTHLREIAPRLRRLLLLLSSGQPGEVAAAAAAIGRTLKSADSDWHALAGALTEAPAQPKAQHAEPDGANDAPDDWDAMREFCLQHSHLLTARETDFLVDLGSWHGTPTARQFSWLNS